LGVRHQRRRISDLVRGRDTELTVALAVTADTRTVAEPAESPGGSSHLGDLQLEDVLRRMTGGAGGDVLAEVKVRKGSDTNACSEFGNERR
jgi:hypothetical protein